MWSFVLLASLCFAVFSTVMVIDDGLVCAVPSVACRCAVASSRIFVFASRWLFFVFGSSVFFFVVSWHLCVFFSCLSSFVVVVVVLTCECPVVVVLACKFPVDPGTRDCALNEA